MAAGLLHRVAVHARDDVAREAVLDLDLELLRAEAVVAHGGVAARGAVLLRLLLVAAVVAEHAVLELVVRQGEVAEPARFDVAARGAVDVRREAAPIKHEDHLPALGERLLHRVDERIAQGRVVCDVRGLLLGRERRQGERRLISGLDDLHRHYRGGGDTL